MAYCLIALMILGAIVAAYIIWYQSWPQQNARKRKRDLLRNEQQQKDAAFRSGH